MSSTYIYMRDRISEDNIDLMDAAFEYIDTYSADLLEWLDREPDAFYYMDKALLSFDPTIGFEPLIREAQMLQIIDIVEERSAA